MNDNDRHRYEGGLRYQLSDCDSYWSYCPDGSFTVDGIDYHRAARDGVYVARTMIEFLDDIDDASCGAYMHCSEPPTDQELRFWIRTGKLPHRPPAPPAPAPPRYFRRRPGLPGPPPPVQPLPVDF